MNIGKFTRCGLIWFLLCWLIYAVNGAKVVCLILFVVGLVAIAAWTLTE